MNYYLFQQKLSQIEELLKKHIASFVLNKEACTLSEYVNAFFIFINDFDVVNLFGDDIIDYSYLACDLNITKYETAVEFEWNFRTHDNIDQDRNMIYFKAFFADRYVDNGEFKYHYIAIEEVYKVEDFRENIFFDVNLESSFQDMISDVYYQAMKDEEPIAMSIYRYSDN